MKKTTNILFAETVSVSPITVVSHRSKAPSRVQSLQSIQSDKNQVMIFWAVNLNLRRQRVSCHPLLYFDGGQKSHHLQMFLRGILRKAGSSKMIRLANHEEGWHVLFLNVALLSSKRLCLQGNCAWNLVNLQVAHWPRFFFLEDF